MSSSRTHRERTGGARALVIAVLAVVAGAALGAWGWMQQPHQWWYSYLVAWLFWAGISLGSLSLLLLHNLTGGAWGDAIRPRLRGAVAVLPLLGLLFLPIALAPEHIYHWADESVVAHDEILAHKRPYLNVESFQIRAAVYATIWLLLTALLAWQARTVVDQEGRAERRFSRLSGQGLALHGLAVTFAAIDWMMSLEPHWFSAIYGVMVFVGHGLAALALAVCLTCDAYRRRAPHPVEIAAQHDLGKLLLGFVMLWAYMSFSQFLIIWYGNLPEEVVWYLRRIEGGWKWTAIALATLHFAVPFGLLLGRHWKRSPERLGAVATLLLAMHWVDTVWLVEPAVEREAGASFFPWLDAGLTAAIGGLWWIAFALLQPRGADSLDRREAEGRHG